VITFVALIVQEFAVRFTLPDFNPNNQLRFNRPDGSLPVLGPLGRQFQQVKNSGDYNVSVTFNRYGLRDSKDVKLAVAEDIILVGDSFAFGWGVKETERVSEQLERQLGRKIFNVATPSDVPGYKKLLDYARSIGAKTRNVVLLFNMYDDILYYDAPSAPVRPIPTKKVKTSPRWSFQSVKEFLLANSSLYFLSTSVITQNSWLRHLALKAGLIVPLTILSKRTIDERAIASTVKHLKMIAQSYNTLILLIPNRGIWIGDNQAYERQVHSRFLTALQKSGIPFVDMLPFQERDGNPMRYHFVNDGHWRPLGHSLAASILAERMSAMKPNGRLGQ